MQISALHTTIMRTNTYTVFSGDRAFIVDPGASADKLYANIKAVGAELDGILLTHAHFDHIGAVAELMALAQNDGMRPAVFLHRAELDFVTTEKNLAAYMNRKVEPFVPDVLLRGGEEISVAGLDVKVLHTPGHSPGGVCYLVSDKNEMSGHPCSDRAEAESHNVESSLKKVNDSLGMVDGVGNLCAQGKVLFSGDTLFRMTYGRTDLFDGSFAQLKNSIVNKLFRLSGDVRVLPGHGDETTLEFERINNPINFEKE